MKPSRSWEQLSFGSPSNRTIFIVEPRWEGHRPYFVELLSTQALDRGLSVQWLIGNSQGSCAVENPRLVDQLISRTVVSRSLKSAISGMVESVGSRHSATFFLDGDHYLRSPLSESTPKLRLLLLRSPYCFPDVPVERRALKKALCRVAQLRGTEIFHLTLPGSEPNRLPGQWVYDPSPFIGLPEPSHVEHVDHRGHGSELTWVGAFGHLDARKNVPFLVAALKRLSGLSIGLRLVGPWSDSDALAAIEAACARQGTPLDLLPYRVTNQQLRDSLLNTDLVCILNSNEASSGILLGAAALGRPRLLSGSQALRRAAPIFGAEWAPLNVDEIAQSIETQLSSDWDVSSSYSPSVDGAEFWQPLLEGLG